MRLPWLWKFALLASLPLAVTIPVAAEESPDGQLLVRDFLDVAAMPVGDPPARGLARWQQAVTVVPSGHIPDYMPPVLDVIAKGLSSQTGIGIEVSSARKGQDPRRSAIFIHFVDDANAGELARMFEKIGVPLLQPGSVTENFKDDRVCHVHNAIDEQGVIVRSRLVVGVNFQVADLSSPESLATCVSKLMLRAMGLSVPSLLVQSAGDGRSEPAYVSERDFVFLQALYDPRLPTGPMSPAIEAVLPMVVADAVAATRPALVAAQRVPR